MAAEGASNSNLTQSAGATAITEDYVHDHGSNNAAVGHRRWLLYPQTRSMGSGDVQGPKGTQNVAANALWVFDSQAHAPRPAVRDGFVAWPPPGYVPHTTVYPRWSVSYPDADFSQARVSMTENGQPMATQIEALTNGYGENTLVWFPGSIRDGGRWARPTADTRYVVTVSNVRLGTQTTGVTYVVNVFDADTPLPWSAPGSVRGGEKQTVGNSARYELNSVSGAMAYQWISRPLAALVWAEGAETGGAGVALAISAGYDAMPTGVASEGSHAFHLAHVQPVDQILNLRTSVVPNAATRLRFASRLALATSAQSALVEVSADEGRTWTVAYRQDGTGEQGERAFVVREVPLAAYAGRSLQLRMRYAKPGGNYYPQATDGIGWYLDDLQLLDGDTLTDSGPPSESVLPTQTLSFASEGRWLVQARPGMYGLWPAWSAGIVVQAASTSRRVDCLFNWAEGRYADLLTPHGATLSSSPYVYRAYPGEFYVGYSTADSHIYTLSGGVLQDLGLSQTWLDQAGC